MQNQLVTNELPVNELVFALHEKALSAARDYKKSEMALIEILESLDQHRGYRNLGYPSLTQYCLQALRLSESISFSLISVMRKSREVPALRMALASDEITMSKARKLVSVITPNNSEEWLIKARELTSRELEREVVGEAPETFDLERIRYVGGRRREVRFIISEDEYFNIKTGLDVLSRKKKRQVGLRELLVEANAEYVNKHDPYRKCIRAIRRAERKHIRQEKMSSKLKDDVAPHLETVPGNSKSGRKPIPESIKQAVIYRDEGRCTHVDPAGARCPNTRWIHLHHIKSVRDGGENTVENLKVLCSGHHRMLHQNEESSRLSGDMT